MESVKECEIISRAEVKNIDLAVGETNLVFDLPRELFYSTLSDQSGFDIRNDGDLMGLLTDLSEVKTDYEKIRDALKDVREKGYGIVLPTVDEMKLQEPEIVRQGGRYGV
jgi:stage IV sporulation protein A